MLVVQAFADAVSLNDLNTHLLRNVLIMLLVDQLSRKAWCVLNMSDNLSFDINNDVASVPVVKVATSYMT